jgi:hypothetical protein
MLLLKFLQKQSNYVNATLEMHWSFHQSSKVSPLIARYEGMYDRVV